MSMNDLQKKQFELLKVFVDICDKLSLNYFLVCGSALGAVKYNGFIPWDDDIDVALVRKDYEIFLEKAPSMLKENLFLQNYRSDREFPHVFSKLRDSSTTFIEKGVEHLNINHGVYIDVFPLDGYPLSKKEQKKFDRKKKLATWKQYCTLGDGGNKKIRFRNRIFRILGYHKRTHKTLKKLEQLISSYPTQSADIWCNHGNWQGKKEYAKRWQYGKGTKAVFEGLCVTVPENYDAYLTQKYGDWRSDLSEDKKYGHHHTIVCDITKPYTHYTENKKGGK